MNLAPDRIREVIASFRAPDRRQYPELDEYTRDELYQACSGGGGLYLATRMVRMMRLQAGDVYSILGVAEAQPRYFLRSALA